MTSVAKRQTTWRHRAALIATVAAALAVTIPALAVAADTFTDVPESHIFHNDIGWLADPIVPRKSLVFRMKTHSAAASRASR